MAIGNVVEDGGYIYVFDQNGNRTAAFGSPGHQYPDDGLKNFTSTTITIKSGSYLFLYDEQGNRTGSQPA